TRAERCFTSARVRFVFFGCRPMGLLQLLQRLFTGRKHPRAGVRGGGELADRIGISQEKLRGVRSTYQEFTNPKRTGGPRRIPAPGPELKKLQRHILRRLLARLKCHPAAMGFELGRSIVTNALPHCGRAVIVRMDLQNFFESTSAERVRDY